MRLLCFCIIFEDQLLLKVNVAFKLERASSIKIVKMSFCLQYFDKMAVTFFLNAAAGLNFF